MRRHAFKGISFRDQTKYKLLGLCAKIIEEYQAQRLKLTLRQLYYQLVSRAVIPNSEKAYKNLGKLVSDGRLGGLLDWTAIEDRVRQPVHPPEFQSLEDLIEAAVNSYRLPRREGQEYYVELWVEKDALAGVLRPVARKYHATLMVNRGYSSQSAMYEAATRIDTACRDGDGRIIARPVVLYLGDLDPSGEDMVRDIRDRLSMFLAGGYEIDEEGELCHTATTPGGWSVDHADVCFLRVEKLALTIEQVEEHTPPPNPTKLTDSRAKAFIEEYGYESWEVDALPPQVLRQIIEERFEELLDMEAMAEVMAQEQLDIARLRELTTREG